MMSTCIAYGGVERVLLDEFIYNIYLQGREIIGVNKVERLIKEKEARGRYKDFCEELDLKPILEYFQLGLEAKVFTDRNGKLLSEDDDLFWGIAIGKYQYTFRRQPLEKLTNTKKEWLLQELTRQGIIQ